MVITYFFNDRIFTVYLPSVMKFDRILIDFIEVKWVQLFFFLGTL